MASGVGMTERNGGGDRGETRTATPPGAFPCIAVLPPGLEEAGAAELAELGASAVQPLRRAVRCRTDLATYYRLHLRARLPFRLLRQLAAFPCRGKDDLYDGVQRAADWGRWLPPEFSFRVDASGSIPGLSHSHYSALQVKNALVDWQRQRWGQRSSVDLDDPDLGLHLHLSPGRPGQTPQASLGLDGSGESLHRRGYRAAMGLAPLKENLAAGLIGLTGWDGSVPLADPLCGSGTLLIEAACMALGRQPGLHRRFALERWPDFDGRLWAQEVEAASALEADQLADGRSLAAVVGNEADPLVLEQARANVQPPAWPPGCSCRAATAAISSRRQAPAYWCAIPPTASASASAMRWNSSTPTWGRW